MMAVAFDASGAGPVFGKPTALFADEYDFGPGIAIANYDVTRDGRFIMLRRGTHGSSLRTVIHWTEMASPQRCRRLPRIPPGSRAIISR